MIHCIFKYKITNVYIGMHIPIDIYPGTQERKCLVTRNISFILLARSQNTKKHGDMYKNEENC